MFRCVVFMLRAEGFKLVASFWSQRRADPLAL
jgi:hypothetical protein